MILCTCGCHNTPGMLHIRPCCIQCPKCLAQFKLPEATKAEIYAHVETCEALDEGFDLLSTQELTGPDDPGPYHDSNGDGL